MKRLAKRKSDLEKGEQWRINVDCFLEMEISIRHKRYIKIIAGDAEYHPVHMKNELNNIQNRTDRVGKIMGLSRKIINENSDVFKFFEYRRYGDPYLKVPSEIMTIDQAWEFFKNRYFLIVKLNRDNKPYSFSDLIPIRSMDKKKWWFSRSKSNETRINIDDFDGYCVGMHEIDKPKPHGYFSPPNLTIVDQLDLLLK